MSEDVYADVGEGFARHLRENGWYVDDAGELVEALLNDAITACAIAERAGRDEAALEGRITRAANDAGASVGAAVGEYLRTRPWRAGAGEGHKTAKTSQT